MRVVNRFGSVVQYSWRVDVSKGNSELVIVGVEMTLYDDAGLEIGSGYCRSRRIVAGETATVSSTEIMDAAAFRRLASYKASIQD